MDVSEKLATAIQGARQKTFSSNLPDVDFVSSIIRGAWKERLASAVGERDGRRASCKPLAVWTIGHGVPLHLPDGVLEPKRRLEVKLGVVVVQTWRREDG